MPWDLLESSVDGDLAGGTGGGFNLEAPGTEGLAGLLWGNAIGGGGAGCRLGFEFGGRKLGDLERGG